MNHRQYELLDNAPDYAQHTATLIRWSENYDHPSHYSLFLDIIGFSDEEYGGYICQGSYAETMSRFGYLECSHLAQALEEYSNRPQDVIAYIREIETETEEEEESND